MKIDCYLYVFLISHVLGDFYFQNEIMALNKENKYSWVVLHSLEYTFVSICVSLLFLSVNVIYFVFISSSIHFLIDSIKYVYGKNARKIKEINLLIIDQLFHVISIVFALYLITSLGVNLIYSKLFIKIVNIFSFEKELLIRWFLAILLLLKPTNILIKSLLNEYKPKEEIDSDYKAGRIIGILERLILLMFIALEQYAALGLVLTAKSIARYDKISKQEWFAEYYLMGTLLSTASVVACKLLLL